MDVHKDTPREPDLAQVLAEFGDALSEYRHLPEPDSALITRFSLVPELLWVNSVTGPASVAEWAAAFGVPLVIDLSGPGYVRAVVAMRHLSVVCKAMVTHRRAYELGAALRIPVSAGGQVEVDTEQLLAALTPEQSVEEFRAEQLAKGAARLDGVA